MKKWRILPLLLIGFFSLTAILIAQNAPSTPNATPDAQTNSLTNSLANALANKAPSQQSAKWDTLSKNILLDKSAVTLTLRLDNLQNHDIVNISAAPLPNKSDNSEPTSSLATAKISSNEILFQASTYFLIGDPEKQTLFEVLGFGAAPPESALHLATNYIYFSRPQNLTGNLIAHIQVPPQTTVKLVINDKMIINSQIAQPLAWRKGVLGKGENHKFAALVKTLKPNIQVLPPDTAFVRIEQLILQKGN
jgi:hypothetical protein